MHTHAFTAIRLHTRSERGWAVIRSSTGAIMVDGAGELVMGLVFHDAAALAADMSAFAAETGENDPKIAALAQEKRRA